MFDDRKKQAEKQYQLDEEKKFKVIALRNKYIGMWVAEKLGIEGEKAKEYAKEVILSDLEEAGDQDVIKKILIDCEKAGVDMSSDIIKEKLSYFFDKAAKTFIEK